MDFNKLDFYTLSRIFEYSRNINILLVSKRFSEVAENPLVMAKYFSKNKYFKYYCYDGEYNDPCMIDPKLRLLNRAKNYKKIFEYLLQILYGTDGYYEHKDDFYNFAESNKLEYIYYNLYTKPKLEKNIRTHIPFGKLGALETVEYSLKPFYNTTLGFRIIYPIKSIKFKRIYVATLLASCFEVDVIKEFGFDKDLVGEEPGKRVIRLYNFNPFEGGLLWVPEFLISVKAYSLLFYFMKNNPIPATDVTDILEEILELVETRTMFYRIANDFNINEIDYDFILDSSIANCNSEMFICAFECKFLGSNNSETDLQIQPLLERLFETENKSFLNQVIVDLVNLKVEIPKQILDKALHKKNHFKNRYGLLSRFPEDLNLMTNERYIREVLNAAEQRNAILLKFLNQHRTLEYNLCIDICEESQLDLYIYLIRAGFKVDYELDSWCCFESRRIKETYEKLMEVGIVPKPSSRQINRAIKTNSYTVFKFIINYYEWKDSEVTKKIISLYGCNKDQYGVLLMKFVKSKESISKLVSYGIKKKHKDLYDCFSEFKEQLEFTEEDFLNACKNGFLDLVKKITEKTKLSDEVLEEGLFIAFKKYRVEIFHLLVQHGAKFHYFSFDIGEIAVGRSSHKGLIMTLKNGAKIDYTKESIFYNACKYGHFQIVKQIITKHRPSNLWIYKGIFFAVRHDQNGIMNYLLSKYSGTQAFYNDLLKIAFDRDNLIGMKKLYQKGAYFSSLDCNIYTPTVKRDSFFIEFTIKCAKKARQESNTQP
ncbi:hypothetical protein BB559_006801 [Furculomyces boomerangus]|uniref:Uncharacterized protein n=1 Tax=Furculomyces boomerangus TaxID=61424 RepID=A0A2T9Y0L5_9FUNG|nr:hypothetical protein BB559_006801 [Furculomyces boomerangus]